MNKEKKYIVLTLAFTILLPVFILIAFELNFFNSWSPETISDVVNPVFFASLGLIPTLLVLLWRGGVFFSWLRHIAWWFLILILMMVGSNGNESNFSNFNDDVFIVNMSMAVLFFVTLIYALIMKKKLVGIPQ